MVDVMTSKNEATRLKRGRRYSRERERERETSFLCSSTSLSRPPVWEFPPSKVVVMQGWDDEIFATTRALAILILVEIFCEQQRCCKTEQLLSYGATKLFLSLAL